MKSTATKRGTITVTFDGKEIDKPARPPVNRDWPNYRKAKPQTRVVVPHPMFAAWARRRRVLGADAPPPPANRAARRKARAVAP